MDKVDRLKDAICQRAFGMSWAQAAEKYDIGPDYSPEDKLPPEEWEKVKPLLWIFWTLFEYCGGHAVDLMTIFAESYGKPAGRGKKNEADHTED